jgi:thiamine kinase-like enzyme
MYNVRHMNNSLHIGIDFDNTLIDYHTLFYTYARKQGHINPQQKKDKQHIKHIMTQLPDGASHWTRLQGLVYGTYIKKAKVAKGFYAFLDECRKQNIRLSIISHKTVHPFIGQKINLHKAGFSFIQNDKILHRFFNNKNIHFVQTLDEKLALIHKIGCTHFIDDLTDVLLSSHFPKNVEKILYSAENIHKIPPSIQMYGNWNTISSYLFHENRYAKRAIKRVLDQKFPQDTLSIHLVYSGINSIIYRIKTGKNGYIKAKYYKQKSDELHDSIQTEWNTLSYLWKNNIRSINKPVAIFPKDRISLFTYLDGVIPTKKKINKTTVDQMIAFIKTLKKISAQTQAVSLSNAKESCFTISSYFKIIQIKLKSLETSSKQTKNVKRLLDFLQNEYIPLFSSIKKYIHLYCQKKGLPLDYILPQTNRIISPSDVSFTNCILQDTNLNFVDFEYAGWDDPAKLVADLLSRPDGNIPTKFQQYFYKRMISVFKDDHSFHLRFLPISLLITCKWCLIILNIWKIQNNSVNDSKRIKQLQKARKHIKKIHKWLKINK